MTIWELEGIIHQYGSQIYSFCKQLTGDRQLADELYQDCFLKAMESLERIEADGNVKSYLLSVAVRLWKNKKRKFAWRRRIAPMEELNEETVSNKTDVSHGPLQSYLKKEQTDMVRLAVSRLADTYRIPVLLYYMEELTVSQIAEVMGIPPGTVKSRLYKARKQLEAELEDYYEDR